MSDKGEAQKSNLNREAFGIYGPFIGKLLEINLLLAQQLDAEIIKRIEAEGQASEANIDPLTGLLRRDGFIKACKNPSIHQSRVRRDDAINCLLMIDVDNFKHYNDSYGHQTGDIVLRGVADRLKHNVREDDLLGRWGGDEFVAFLPETDAEGGLTLASKLVNSVNSEPVTVMLPDGSTPFALDVTTTIGVALIEEDNLELSQFYADRALYKAKMAGKNTVAFVNPDSL
jgi:diguanylate cyclase (GGDEF)-like protein